MKVGEAITNLHELDIWITQKRWVYLKNKNGDMDLHSYKMIKNSSFGGVCSMIARKDLYKAIPKSSDEYKK